jgi:hypothetical protein
MPKAVNPNTKVQPDSFPKGVKVIKPYRKKPSNMKTLEGSLYENGYTFIPETSRTFLPRVSGPGYVKTGIDPEALKVQRIFDEEIKAKEVLRLTKLKEHYERLLGRDLGPTSDFYHEILENGYSLEDGDNLFNMEDPREAVNFYWLMETGMIANSLEELESGKLDPSIVKYYVYDKEVDTSTTFKRKRKANEARVKLDGLTSKDRERIAKLLGLGVGFSSTDEDVYNILDNYLDRSATQLGLDPIDNFMKYSTMSGEVVEVKTLILDLLRANIVRLQGSMIWEGPQMWAKSQDEFELFLLDKSNQEARDAFEDKLRNKLAIDNRF